VLETNVPTAPEGDALNISFASNAPITLYTIILDALATDTTVPLAGTVLDKNVPVVEESFITENLSPYVNAPALLTTNCVLLSRDTTTAVAGAVLDKNVPVAPEGDALNISFASNVPLTLYTSNDEVPDIANTTAVAPEVPTTVSFMAIVPPDIVIVMLLWPTTRLSGANVPVFSVTVNTLLPTTESSTARLPIEVVIVKLLSPRTISDELKEPVSSVIVYTLLPTIESFAARVPIEVVIVKLLSPKMSSTAEIQPAFSMIVNRL
jgi:hypothetical protein